MTNIKVRSGYGPAVENRMVPRIYLDDSAGRIVGQAAQGLAGAIGDLGDAFRMREQKKEQMSDLELQAAFSDWTFETESAIQERINSAEPNQLNLFEQVDADVTNRAASFLDRVNQINPRLSSQYKLRLTDQVNSMRARMMDYDYKRKGRYVVGRAMDMLSNQQLRLENNPEALEQAKTFVQDFIYSVDDADMGKEEKAKILADSEQKLMAVAYGKMREDELRRGPDWAKKHAKEILLGPAGGMSDYAPAGKRGEVFSRFMGTVSKGLKNPYALAVVAGYSEAESSFAPGNLARDWDDPSVSGKPGRSGGVLSWRNERLERLRRFAGANISSPEVQAEFFLQEDPTLIAKLEGAESLEEASAYMAEAWKMKGWQPGGAERERRLNMSKKYLGQIETDTDPNEIDVKRLDLPGPQIWEQFIREKHPELWSRFGADVQKLQSDKEMKLEAAEWYVGVIADGLHREGLPINRNTIHLGFQVGAAQAAEILKAPIDTLLKDILDEQTLRDRGLDGEQTAGEYRDAMKQRTGSDSYATDLDSDPRFATLDYDTRQAALGAAEKRVSEQAIEEYNRKKAINANNLNTLLMGIQTGQAGRKEINEAMGSWLTNYDDVVKANKALEAREKELEGWNRAVNKFASGDLWNKDDSKDQASFDAFTKRTAGDLIQKRDPGALNALASAITMSGGTIVPKLMVGQLEGMLGSGKWSDAKYAYDVLAGLVDINPRLMKGALDEATFRRVRAYSSWNGNLSEEQVKTLSGQGMSAEQLANFEKIVPAATAAAEKEVDDWANKANDLFDGWLTWAPDVDVEDRMALGALQAEWTEMYVAYAQLGAAYPAQMADKEIQETWGIGLDRRIMKYPTRLFFPDVPEEDIDKEIRELYKIPDNYSYRLMSDHITETRVSQKILPDYSVFIFNEDGILIEGHTGLNYDIERFPDGNRYIPSTAPSETQGKKFDEEVRQQKINRVLGEDYEKRIGTQYELEQNAMP